jgi:hypothetical protein
VGDGCRQYKTYLDKESESGSNIQVHLLLREREIANGVFIYWCRLLVKVVVELVVGNRQQSARCERI